MPDFDASPPADEPIPKSTHADTPDNSFQSADVALGIVARWDKIYAAGIVSGLTTVPDYHANGIRLDWLQRIVLSKANGHREPNFKEIERALNGGLGQAGITHREDPIEDLLCDSLATATGNYRIFAGQWESAPAFTQVMIEAFEALPPGRRKRDTLAAVYAILRLSDAVAERARVDRTSESGGTPFGAVTLPHTAALKQIARRVIFTPRELEQLAINPKALSPFILEDEQLSLIGSNEVGETPLEFHPLLPARKDILVASPASISLAVRAVLVQAAIDGGIGDLFHLLVLKAQERYAESTGFWPTIRINLSEPDRDFLRASVCQYDRDRFLHVMQLPCDFNGFPGQGFMTTRRLSDRANETIQEDIGRFWELLKAQPDVSDSATILLMGGWGPPQIVHPTFDAASAPPHWQLVIMGFSDAAILGACDDGKLRDILRMNRIETRHLQDEYTFVNPNGLLNLFGFWKSTGGSIVPDNMADMLPPAFIRLPTDSLLEPRREGIVRRDYRSLPTPDGAFKTVQRRDWGKDSNKPIYASVKELEADTLAGVFAFSGRTWWIETPRREGQNLKFAYNVWNGVLEWLAAVAPTIVERFPNVFPSQAVKVTLTPPDHGAVHKVATADIPLGAPGDNTIDVSLNQTGAALLIREEWLASLRSAENGAETSLIAAVLHGVAGDLSPGRAALRRAVEEAIASKDWRWMHAREALTPLDRLAGRGLVREFEPIRFSALAFAKVGSVWKFRDRGSGLEVSGEDDCKQFLVEYRDSLLASIVAQIRQFNRQALTIALARAYQAARYEKFTWRTSIRALRAIQGGKADLTAFERQNEVNAVQRMAKALAEIAACEAGLEGDRLPGKADLEEMYANAMLLIGNGQLFPVIRSGLIEPRLKISPAGDLMSERGVLQDILEPSATWTNSKALDEAAIAYVADRRDPSAQSAVADWDDALRLVIESEYQIAAELYVNLPFFLGRLAEEKGEDVFIERRSVLQRLLADNASFAGQATSPVLDRLTLGSRPSWFDGLSELERDLCRFDRHYSLISRPLLMVEDGIDPLLLIAPALVTDSIVFAISGLTTGHLNNAFWRSIEARRYAGEQGDAAGRNFEEEVAARLNELGLSAQARCKLSTALNQKVDPALGDVDILAINADQSTVWVIEAKNLRLCRTEAEVASRFSEYQGRTYKDSKGKDRPDKLLRHLRRIEHLRDNRDALRKNLKLQNTPDVKGLLIFDTPQPMNFYALRDVPDGQSAFLDRIGEFAF